MLKNTIYNWIKKLGEKGTNPNFDDIMIKFSDDYEIKDIENALESLKEEGESQNLTFAASFISKHGKSLSLPLIKFCIIIIV